MFAKSSGGRHAWHASTLQRKVDPAAGLILLRVDRSEDSLTKTGNALDHLQSGAIRRDLEGTSNPNTFFYPMHNPYIVIHHIWSRAPRPPPTPPNGLGSRSPSVVWVVVGLIGNLPPSFPPCGVGSGGWESPSLWCGSGGWECPSLFLPLWCGVLWVGIPLPLPCGVWWVGIPLPPPCGVGFGGVEFVLGSLGGVESVVLPEWGLLILVKLL